MVWLQKKQMVHDIFSNTFQTISSKLIAISQSNFIFKIVNNSEPKQSLDTVCENTLIIKVGYKSPVCP